MTIVAFEGISGPHPVDPDFDDLDPEQLDAEFPEPGELDPDEAPPGPAISVVHPTRSQTRRPESVIRNSERWCFIDPPGIGQSSLRSSAAECGRASKSIYLEAVS